MTYTRTVLTKVPKASDIEIHVSTIDTDYGPFAEVREYVVSLDQYGRGITFPAAAREQIAKALAGASDG